jgi:hypothetical protein
MISRICSSCKIEKSMSEFYKDKHESSGYKYKCKICFRIDYQKNNQRILKNAKNRYKRKPEGHISQYTKFLPFTKIPVTAKNRFYSKILLPNENGCMEWAGKPGVHGYANFLWLGKSFRAHRFSFLLHNGYLPKDKDICHTCDNRKCVAPDHLWAGTKKENIHDMEDKKRSIHPKGEGIGTSKLKEIQVKEIKRLLKNGLSPEKISTKYNVSAMTIRRIKNNITWKHIYD